LSNHDERHNEHIPRRAIIGATAAILTTAGDNPTASHNPRQLRVAAARANFRPARLLLVPRPGDILQEANRQVQEHGFPHQRPPTFPFFSNVNPNVVAVLDTKSFSHLFDMELVEKKNVLVGDFMPSVKFTGDIRVCAYLDTAEPQHAKV
jgi:hypothetical protein